MKNFGCLDLHKYDKKPIPEYVNDIKAEIKKLQEENKKSFLSPIEHQLILDRISACEDKIKKLTASNVKVTPVLGTVSISQIKNRKPVPDFSLKEGSMII